MKITIKNIYGLQTEKEMVFDSGENKNLVIFAPNGIGKSSIFKAFKNIKEETLYFPLNDEEKENYFLNFQNLNSNFIFSKEEKIVKNSDKYFALVENSIFSSLSLEREELFLNFLTNNLILRSNMENENKKKFFKE